MFSEQEHLLQFFLEPRITMDILTLMTNNNNCDILRKSSSPDFRVPPINLDDLPKFLLGEAEICFLLPVGV